MKIYYLMRKLLVFGNLPYNISTEILSRWIINLKDNFWFDHLILMFQKEVAETELLLNLTLLIMEDYQS